MKEHPNNPPSNKIGPGFTEDQLKEAVSNSGYPLQSVVGDILRAKVSAKDQGYIQEEWSYLDRDTKSLRTLDLYTEMRLHEWEPQPRVRPILNLLIECKQSDLPYVFFEGAGPYSSLTFPVVAGLRKSEITIHTDDDPSTWSYSIPHALDLHRDSFQATPCICHTFSKCVRKGPALELSGSEAYNGVVLPLVKSLQHYLVAQEPIDTAMYFDCRAVLAVGVLDAPMFSVSVSSTGPVITAVPWVRVIRHEYHEDANPFDRNESWMVDIVHKDFFDRFLEENVFPFARRFGEKVLRHPTELATGVAFVPNMGTGSFDRIEDRMKSSSLGTKVGRGVSVGKNILRSLSRKRKTKKRRS